MWTMIILINHFFGILKIFALTVNIFKAINKTKDNIIGTIFFWEGSDNLDKVLVIMFVFSLSFVPIKATWLQSEPLLN